MIHVLSSDSPNSHFSWNYWKIWQMFMPKFNTKTFILTQVSFPKNASPLILVAVHGAVTSFTIRPIYFPESKLDAHIAVFW